MYSIKFNYNEEVRRVQIAKENGALTFIQLSTTLRNIYPEIKNKQISLLYKDDEGDLVTVSSNEELAESVRVMESNGDGAKPLRYTVRTTLGNAVPVVSASNIDPAMAKKQVFHNGVRCDECGMVPIEGTRFKCTTREDFDLCSKCEASKTQPYPMIKIEDPAHAPQSLLYAYKDPNIDFGTMPGRGYGGRGGRGGRGNGFGGRGVPPHHHGPPPGFHHGPPGGPHQGPHDHGHGHGFHHRPHGPPAPIGPGIFNHPWNPFGNRAWGVEKGPERIPTASPVLASSSSVPAVPAPVKCEKERGELRADAAPFIQGMDAAVMSGNNSVCSNGSGGDLRSHYSRVDMPVSELNNFMASLTHSAEDNDTQGDLGPLQDDPDSDTELQQAIRDSFADMALAAKPSSAEAPAGVATVNVSDSVDDARNAYYDEDAHLAAALEDTAPLFVSQQLPPQQSSSSLLSPNASQMMGISSLTNSYASNIGGNSFVFPPSNGIALGNGSLSSAVSVSSLPKKYEMRFVRDVTFPNGTMVHAGAVFKKIWRVRNDGLYDYPDNVTLAFAGGDVLGDVTVHECVPELKVGEECEVSTTLVAPEHSGRYVTYFRMETKDEVKFGQRLYANIQVIDEESDWHIVGVNAAANSAQQGDSQETQDSSNDNESVVEGEGEHDEDANDEQSEAQVEGVAVVEVAELSTGLQSVLECSIMSTGTEHPSDVFYACRDTCKKLSSDDPAAPAKTADDDSVKRATTPVVTAAVEPEPDAAGDVNEGGDVDDQSVDTFATAVSADVPEDHVPVPLQEEEEVSEFAAEIALIDAASAEEDRRVREAAERERAAAEAEAVAAELAARDAMEFALAEEAAAAAHAEQVAAEEEAIRAAELAASLNPVTVAPAAPTAGSGSRSNSTAILWRTELQLLSEMGFDDVDVLVPLLQTHVGTPSSIGGETNVEGMQRVVATLLNSFGMLR